MNVPSPPSVGRVFALAIARTRSARTAVRPCHRSVNRSGSGTSGAAFPSARRTAAINPTRVVSVGARISSLFICIARTPIVATNGFTITSTRRGHQRTLESAVNTRVSVRKKNVTHASIFTSASVENSTIRSPRSAANSPIPAARHAALEKPSASLDGGRSSGRAASRRMKSSRLSGPPERSVDSWRCSASATLIACVAYAN